ncbi:transposase [Candidatus Gottesmanbacteria bacterium]|nr:transposase [Candidatus Gottesmanbacteria bacterium]
MNLDYLTKHPELFPSVIGITHTQFHSLLYRFSFALRSAEQVRAFSKKRLRGPGGGRKPTLRTDVAKLFFILFYYKVYPTFRLAQALFGLDKRNIFTWKAFLEPVLFAALRRQLVLPTRRVSSMHGLLDVCPGLAACIVDATERPIHRPKNPTDQTHFYSGKKKRHTVKNQIIIHPITKRILAVSRTVEGKRHDKKLLEDDAVVSFVPPGGTVLGDSGYQGVGVTVPWARVVTPMKKSPGKDLSQSQKAANRVLSSVRVRVEHTIAYLKHFAILSQVFRGSVRQAHQPFTTIACLYNYTREVR